MQAPACRLLKNSAEEKTSEAGVEAVFPRITLKTNGI